MQNVREIQNGMQYFISKSITQLAHRRSVVIASDMNKL